MSNPKHEHVPPSGFLADGTRPAGQHRAEGDAQIGDPSTEGPIGRRGKHRANAIHLAPGTIGAEVRRRADERAAAIVEYDAIRRAEAVTA
jgi:hypothetical protein